MPQSTIEYASGARLHGLFKEVFALYGVMSEVVDEIHEKAGLRTSWIRVANTLSDLEVATVPDVAMVLNVSRQFVQTVFNDLLEQRMLFFKENPRHKRSKLASLTEYGHTVLTEAREKESAIVKQALPNIDDKSVAEAQCLLRFIREQVQGNI
jgi:DNA-binding MarR family transcriptional regulator